MVRTVIARNDIAPAAQEQRKKIAVHFRFKWPSCEAQQKWRRGGAAIQNRSPRTNYTTEDKVPDTRRKTMSLIREGRQGPFVFVPGFCAEFQFPKSARW